MAVSEVGRVGHSADSWAQSGKAARRAIVTRGGAWRSFIAQKPELNWPYQRRERDEVRERRILAHPAKNIQSGRNGLGLLGLVVLNGDRIEEGHGRAQLAANLFNQ